MSHLGRNFERILIANYNDPRRQGVKLEVLDISVLKEVEDTINDTAH